MRIKIKHLGIGVGIFFLLLTTLFVAGLLYLNSSRSARLSQDLINRSIPGKVSWQKSEWSPITGKLELREVLVYSEEGQRIACADRLLIRLNPKDLLKRRIVVTDLVLDHPEFDLTVGEDGELNLIRAFGGSQPNENITNGRGGVFPFSIALESFKSSRILVRYVANHASWRFGIREMEIFARADLSMQAGNASVRLSDGFIEGPARAFKIDHLNLSGSYQDKTLDEIALQVESDLARLEISGKIKNVFESPHIDMEIRAEASLSQIQPVFNTDAGFAGDATVRAKIAGSLEDPGADIDIRCGKGVLFDMPVDGLEAKISLDQRMVSVTRADIQVLSGLCRIAGKMDLQTAFPQGFFNSRRDINAMSYTLSVHQQDANLAMLNSNLAGLVDAKAVISGKGASLETLTGDAELEIIGSSIITGSYPHPAGWTIRGKADISNGKARLQDMTGVSGNLTLHSTGAIDLQRSEFSAQLSLDSTDIRTALAPVGLTDSHGNISLKIDASGSFKHPVFDLKLKGKNLVFKEIRVGQVDTAITYNNGGLVIDHARLINRNSTVDIRGDAHLFKKPGFEWAKDPIVNFDIESRALFIENFYDKAKGKFTLSAQTRGSISDLKGGIQLSGSDIVFQDHRIKNVEMISVLKHGRLNVNRLDILPDTDSFVKASGWVSPKAFDLTLSSRGITLQKLPEIKASRPVDGEIFIDLAGGGSFRDPKIKGEVGITGVRVNQTHMPDLKFRVELENRVVRLEGNQDFALSGSYDLDERGFSASLSFQDMDLTPYFVLFKEPHVTGSVNGNVQLRGKVGDPQPLAGSIDVDRLQLGFKGETVVPSGYIKAFFNERELSIDGFHLALPDNKGVDAAGKADVNEQVAVTARGTIPVSAMRLIWPDFADAAGDASFEARIRGDYSNPKIEGHILLTEVESMIPNLSQKIRHLNARMQITPEKVVIASMEGQLDDGRFSVAGDVAMDGLMPAELTLDIKGSSLPIQIPDTVDFLVDTRLSVRGTRDKSRIDGEITLLEGLYYKDVNLSLLEGAGEKKRKKPPSENISTPFLKNMAYNVTLKHRRPFEVDNNLARMDIVPDLKLTGTVNRPVINGRAQVQSGTVVYRKKTFVIQKGVIDFVNPYAIEPAIDIKGEARVREWLISLEISGTPNELKFALSSDPPLEDGDILSLLIVGRTSKEMIQSKGGSSQSAAQMLGQLLASKMDEDIKRTTGLDIFEAELNGTGDTESTGDVKLTIGKELSKRMSVKYSAETEEGEMIQKAIAEYNFLENLLVSGFQDNRGSFGGSIKYRIEFR